jgi:hypothetical protein
MHPTDPLEPPPAPDVPEPAPAAALALVEPPTDTLGELVLHDPRALAAQLETYSQSRQLLVDWLFGHLVPGVDYMLIHRKQGRGAQRTDCPSKADAASPRCPACGGKATLCKPGSEKLCGLLRLRPRFTRDGDTWDMLGGEAGMIALKCELVTATGVVVAEGRGARTREADFGDVNKTVKMCQKSAQTDAVLRCAGLSEIFTQDLEDMPAAAALEDDGEQAFTAPKRQSAKADAAPAAPVQGDLTDVLRTSIAEAAARKALAAADAAAAGPAPAPAVPIVPRAAALANAGDAPADALSRARFTRLLALVHDAVRAHDVPDEEHEAVFDRARAWLTAWVATTQQRDRLDHCSYRVYDELCAQVGPAVEAAVTGARRPAPRYVPRPRAPYPRPRPRLVPTPPVP